MRGIVFSTIGENLRSFFQREDELTAKPRPVPEAASEIYNKPAPALPTQRIVDKPLPQKLPFSPDDLRKALKEQREARPTTPPAPLAAQPVERDITSEIVAFERSLREAHETVEPLPVKPAAPLRPTPPARTIVQAAAPSTQDAPFFNEFEQFLAREDLEADGILEKDLVWRMKEFHKHRQEGKEYYIYSKDVQAAVTRKLGDLKELEREWFDEREQADAIEKRLAVVEHEIELRTQELKTLLRQARQKSRLEQNVPTGSEFVLSDGRRLANLLDLKIALKSMPETVFTHHVTSYKNDFASWVRGAMNDTPLADAMGPLRERQQLEIFLAKLGQ